MYTITNDGRPLFNPTVPGYKLETPMMSMEANKLASMDFTVYPDNPEYDKIEDHVSRLVVYLDGQLMMRFRPAYKKATFAGGLNFRCEELASELNDVFHRPDYFTGTISAYLSRLITAYNAQVDSAHAVQLGNVLYKPNETDTFINDEYEGFWQAMIEHVVDVFGGYIIPRYTADAVYIDYVSDADLPLSGQSIRFGENMADMFLETDSSEVFSVLIPLGPDQEISNPQPGQSRSRPMTIASVNSGRDYLESATGIALYGRREKTQRWLSATSATDLKTKGQAYLDEHAVQLKKTITLSAADLHYLHVNIAAIRWMQRIPIQSEPHGIDTQYTSAKLDIPLGAPKLLKLQMGEPKEVFTDCAPLNSVTGRSSGGRGGRASSTRDQTFWAQRVRYEEEIIAGTGIKQMYETGIELDAVTGARLYSLTDNLFVNQYSELKVNSSEISTLVRKTGINSLGANETLYSQISQNAQAITLKVSAGDVASTINQTAQSVLIQAGKIDLSGYVTASELSATNAVIANLMSGQTSATILSATQYFMLDGSIAQWADVVKTGYVSQTSVRFLGNDDLNLAHYHTITATAGTGANAGKILFTLGAPQATEGSTNFNIADTQFYQDGVSAAEARGASSVTLSGPSWGSSGGTSNSFTVSASNGDYKTQWCYLTRSSWNNGACDVHLRSGTATGTVRATNTVDIGSASNWQLNYTAQGEKVSVTIAGKTFTHTF